MSCPVNFNKPSKIEPISKEELNEMHKLLRKARYFYYEQHKSIMSDYDYDMLEKNYDIHAQIHGVDHSMKISNFVGFDIRIPMNLFY